MFASIRIQRFYIYASNPDMDATESEFLLSNFLVEVSSADETLPIGFVRAFGQTSTLSLLGIPEKMKTST